MKELKSLLESDSIENSASVIEKVFALSMLDSFGTKKENPFAVLEGLEAKVAVCYFDETGQPCATALEASAPSHSNLLITTIACSADKQVDASASVKK